MLRFFKPTLVIAVISYSILQSNLLLGQALAEHPTSIPRSASVESKVLVESTAQWMPETTIAYLHVDQPAQMIDAVLTHPLRKTIERFDDVRNALRSNEYKQMNVGRRVLEMQLEMKWDEAVAALTHGGLDIAFDSKTQSIAVMSTAKDEKTLRSIVDKLVELAGESEKLLKVKVPLKKSEYRSLEVYEIGPVFVGLLGERVLVSNHSGLARGIADRFLDKEKNSRSLSRLPRFQKSQTMLSEKDGAKLYLDLAALRNVDNLKPLFDEKTENIGIEFLVGGIQSNLRQAGYAVARLSLDKGQLKFEAATPHQDRWVSSPREFFFGKDGKGTAPSLLIPENSLFSVTSYRDIGQLWLSKEDLFDEGHVAELAQADSQFSTIFSGLDFGEEILGATKPGFQIVGALQDYTKLTTPSPDIKIPSFAFIFKLKEPEKIQQRFKVGFQSVVGFANIALAQQGQPQLDIDTEKFKDGKLVTTSYLVDEANRDEGLINYNFSPSIAFVGEHFIISSTESLARELIELARKPGDSAGKRTNTFASIDGKMLRSILHDNRDSLIAQNMLEEGSSRKEAEKQIGQILELLNQAENASIRFENHDDRLQLNLEMRFDTNSEAK